MTPPTGARWDARQIRPFDAVPTDAILTHLGRRRVDGTVEFCEEPRWRDPRTERWLEIDVSMLEGELDIADAVRLVRRRPPPANAQAGDAVRYFRAGDLFNAGYYVLRTPSKIPNHVSVYGDLDAIGTSINRNLPGDFTAIIHDQGAHQRWWSMGDRVTLKSLELRRRW